MPYKDLQKRREHQAEYARRNRKSHPPKHRDAVRRWKLREWYGITPEQYDAMLVAQDGRCALFQVCGSTEPGGRWNRWHVDHDHVTGKVRGLLCNDCNLHRVGMNTAESAFVVLKYLKEA